MNQNALLHRASFAMFVILCCAAQAHVQVQAQESTAPSQPEPVIQINSPPSKAALQTEEKTIKAKYASDIQACASKLAPSQCKRQASLDYKQSEHASKLKRHALNTATKQIKHDNSQANKVHTASIAKHGINENGKPLEREPLSKARPTKALGSQQLNGKDHKGKIKDKGKDKDKINEDTAQNVPLLKAPLAPFVKKSTPKVPPKQATKALSTAPTADQRRANVAAFAKKEGLLALRKTQSQDKQSKRAAKDAQRRAAGYAVDRP